MAGTSQSYYRRPNGGTFTTKTAETHQGLNADGSIRVVQVEYREWNAYTHNHIPGSHVMNEDGVCTSNPGMSSGYYEQGPENGGSYTIKTKEYTKSNGETVQISYREWNGKGGPQIKP